MKKNLQKELLKRILDLIRPLTLLASDEANMRQFFDDLGWDVAELLDGDLYYSPKTGQSSVLV